MSIYVDIEKSYGTFHLSVQLDAGDETLALLGGSGSGKSLTLKCIDLSPQERRTGLVFQNYALFPHMTVLENIRAGARREPDAQKRADNVDRIVERFGLGSLTGHTPAMLSGGQQQRVALARILVSEPRILLLDEPFSALDGHLRHRLEDELKQVIESFGKTVVLVSHNRREVFRLSDRIAVLEEGRVGAVGTREEIFRNPGTRSGAALTGCKNISRIRQKSDRLIEAMDWGIDLFVDAGMAGDAEQEEYAGIRSHDIAWAGHANSGNSPENMHRFDVLDEIENPFSYTVILRAQGRSDAEPLQWDMDKQAWQQIRASSIDVCLPPASILLLKK